MKINDQEGKTLMALRAGPTGSHELYERFPSGPSTSSLLKKGLVELRGGDYYITELGRQHCPVRRQAKEPMAKTLPVLMQEQTVQKIARKPETISITPVFNIVKAVPTVKAVPEKDHEMTTQNEAPKSKALQMLEYIEKHPNCTMNEMIKDIGYPVGDSYIPGYIGKEVVVVGKNAEGKKTYKLADGFNAHAAYASRQGKKKAIQTTANVKQNAVHITPAVEKAPAKTLPEEYEIPSFLTQPQIKLDLESPVQSAVDGKHIPAPAQSGSFRVAYTNDGCIILLGIYPLPIELDAKQSEILMKFSGDIALSRTVAAEIENNVGAYLK